MVSSTYLNANAIGSCANDEKIDEMKEEKRDFRSRVVLISFGKPVKRRINYGDE